MLQRWATYVPYGWVDVLRYNKSNIIFLKGHMGDYDFLIEGSKDTPFKHKVYDGYLHAPHSPRQHGKFQFQKWLYFDYYGWEEFDRHLAEKYYYESGGRVPDYPGKDEVFKDWLISKGKFKQPSERAKLQLGFSLQRLTCGDLCISPLISVGEFRNFVQSGETYYADYRKSLPGEKDMSSLLHESRELPAAVSWFDAMAYASWFSDTHGLPVRLMEEEEYNEFYKDTISPKPFDGWDSCRDSEELELVEGKQGADLVRNPRFGEWLNKAGSAVNTAFLGSLCYPDLYSAYRAPTAPESTGQYKGMKVGFRLCYLHKDT